MRRDTLVIRTVALGSALAASTAIAAHVGATTLGGHQIALQVWLLLALTLDALAVPAQVYVGTALGRRDADDAVEIGRRCLRLALAASAIVGVATMALSPALPYVFSGDPGVRSRAVIGLLLCGALQPFAAATLTDHGLGITGIWLALTCWLAARCVLLGLRWRSRQWVDVRRVRTSPVVE
jgi:Na+-driven multidrug efflux pump